MKIISANLNGIRAATRKGFYDWLPKVDADIVCLQELKAQEDQIEGEPYHPKGYHTPIFIVLKKRAIAALVFTANKSPTTSNMVWAKALKISTAKGAIYKPILVI